MYAIAITTTGEVIGILLMIGVPVFSWGTIMIILHLRETVKPYQLVKGKVVQIRKENARLESFAWLTPLVEYEYQGKTYQIESRKSGSTEGTVMRFASKVDYQVGDAVNVRVYSKDGPKGVIDNKENVNDHLHMGIFILIFLEKEVAMPRNPIVTAEVLLGLAFLVMGFIWVFQFLLEHKKPFEIVSGKVVDVKKSKPLIGTFSWLTPVIEYEHKGKSYQVQSRRSGSTKGLLYRFAVDADRQVGEAVNVRLYSGKESKGVIDDKRNVNGNLYEGIFLLVLGAIVMGIGIISYVWNLPTF